MSGIDRGERWRLTNGNARRRLRDGVPALKTNSAVSIARNHHVDTALSGDADAAAMLVEGKDHECLCQWQPHLRADPRRPFAPAPAQRLWVVRLARVR